MPARNIDHDAVVQALRDDGWTITHDPLTLSVGDRFLFVDLGAQRSTVAAQRGDQQIAVEIKTFGSASLVRDLEEAVGKYVAYRAILAHTEPDRVLFLAVTDEVYGFVFSEPLGRLVAQDVQIRFLIFAEQEGKVLQWIS
jgi:hypothetical protein